MLVSTFKHNSTKACSKIASRSYQKKGSVTRHGSKPWFFRMTMSGRGTVLISMTSSKEGSVMPAQPGERNARNRLGHSAFAPDGTSLPGLADRYITSGIHMDSMTAGCLRMECVDR